MYGKEEELVTVVNVVECHIESQRRRCPYICYQSWVSKSSVPTRNVDHDQDQASGDGVNATIGVDSSRPLV